MFSRILLSSILLPLLSCAASLFDTSTPEKFVKAMGLISEQAQTVDPLPYFYDEVSAAAIAKFDKGGEKTLAEFDQFRELVATKFPYHTKKNEEGAIKIALDGYAGMRIRTLTYGATLIGAQLKERKPSDYEFISATDPDENNVVQLTLKITGNERTLPIKKTKDGYRMFLGEDVLISLDESIQRVTKLEQVFIAANQELENGDITKANFEEKMEAIVTEYERALE